MRARDIVGKRIVSLRQQRCYCAGTGRHLWHVNAIVLEDGTRMYFYPVEDGVGAEIFVTGNTVKPKELPHG